MGLLRNSCSIIFLPSFIVAFYIVPQAHPAEIVRPVVLLVAVYVIGGGETLGVRVLAESRRHQTAHQVVAGLSVLGESHPGVALVIHESGQQPLSGVLA